MTISAAISQARVDFHQAVLSLVLRVTAEGTPNNADKDSSLSVAIAKNVLGAIGTAEQGAMSGQSLGSSFEQCCERFLNATFPKLHNVRPGDWVIDRSGPSHRAGAKGIARFEQYGHLIALKTAAETSSELAAALGTDYIIKPDIMVYRSPVDDVVLNADQPVVDAQAATLTSLRSANQEESLLHASVSCKWTIRSDRSQNSRAEALNLIRNRKGHVPHIVAVTAEPLPSRIASIALGTGDLDCVYHFALYELQHAVAVFGNDDSKEILNTMINGKRLKDISDLPLDLAI